MAEKIDSGHAQMPVATHFQTPVDPQKNAMVVGTVDDCAVDPSPPPPPPTMSLEPEKPVKEGYNYWNHLPYDVEDDDTRLQHLNLLIEDLYIYVRAGDFEGGARTASRQIKRWLHLKFKMPKEIRKKLVKLYYELSLTPGIDPSAADTFATMFKLLASYVPRCQLT
jgi:proteasome activator subunit 4